MTTTDTHPARTAKRDYVDTSEFWEGIHQSSLVLQYCSETGQYQHYPRPVSVHTGRKSLSWRPVDTKGVIYALTRGTLGGREPGSQAQNIDIALVELDVGVRILAVLELPDGEQAKIGQPVRVSWMQHPDGYKYYAFQPADAV